MGHRVVLKMMGSEDVVKGVLTFYGVDMDDGVAHQGDLVDKLVKHHLGDVMSRL